MKGEEIVVFLVGVAFPFLSAIHLYISHSIAFSPVRARERARERERERERERARKREEAG